MLFPSVLMWLVFGAFSAYVANKRGKNPYLWFFWGMFFGIFGILFLFFSPKPKPQASSPHDSNTIDITPIFTKEHQDKLWYYIDEKNERHGPMSFQALSKAWKEGKLLPSTYVWNENLPDWRPFSEFIRQN